MNNQFSENYQRRAGERGNISLVAVLFLGFITVTALGVTYLKHYSEGRNIDNSITGTVEKWAARADANILTQIVSRDASQQFLIDLQKARTDCGASSNLKLFDDVNAGSSSPAATFNEMALKCENQPNPSSVFGTVGAWISARKPLFEKTGRDLFNLNAEKVGIIEMQEIYRRSYATETAYAVRFIIEAKNGNYRTRTNGEVMLGTTAPVCRTTADLTVNPATVTRGQAVEFRASWSYASRIRIYNSSGTAIYDSPLTESNTLSTGTYNYTPGATDTYYAVFEGSGGCNARSSSVVVTVNEPPAVVCPVINDFSSTPNPVTTGGTFTIAWNVSNALSVTIDGASRGLSGTRTYGGISSARTFTLVARSQSGTCDLTRTLTVNVQAPSCPYAMPTINSFSGTPARIRAGQSINLSWNVSGLESSGEVRILGNSGYNQAFGASGSTTVTPTETNTGSPFYYTLQATNVCPDGNRLTITRDFAYEIVACPPPSIDAFSVNPNVVTIGANQLIRFSWSISGTADAVSIDNGVGGGLPASGAVDVSQPNQTTLYTITAVGCGVTRQAQFTVTANNPPPPPASGCLERASVAGSIVTGPEAPITINASATFSKVSDGVYDVYFNWSSNGDETFVNSFLVEYPTSYGSNTVNIQMSPITEAEQNSGQAVRRINETSSVNGDITMNANIGVRSRLNSNPSEVFELAETIYATSKCQ